MHNWEYLIKKEFITEQTALQIKNAVLNRFVKNQFAYDKQCPNSPSIENALAEVEELITATVEETIGTRCYFQFDYSRIYFSKGEVLVPHLDKKNCDVIVSITIDYMGADVWPLNLYSEIEKKIIELKLDRRDAVIYQGDKVLHWRNPFAGLYQIQSFFLFSSVKKTYFDLSKIT